MSSNPKSDELQTQINYALVEKLSYNQKRHSKLLSLLDECIFECDQNFNLTYVNPAWKRQLGYQDKVLLESRLTEFLATEKDDRVFSDYLSRLGCKDVNQAELQLVPSEGPPRWFELRLVETDTDGKGFIGSFFDIQQHKNMEERLRKQEHYSRQLSLVARHTNNLVIIADREGRIEWVNSSFEEQSGYKLQEVTGMTPGEFLQGPATDPETIRKMSRAIKEGKEFTVEIANYRRSGELYWVAIDASPVLDDDGRISHFIAVETDITQRIIAEEAAAKSEFNYRSVVDNIKEVVLQLRPNGEMTFINHAWQSLTGLDPEGCLNKPIANYVGELYKDLINHAIAAYRAGKRTNTRTDIQIRKKNSSDSWVEMTMTPIESGQQGTLTSIAVTLVDIDERVESARALQMAKNQAESLAEAKSRFLANISHEIRTPLNAIIGSSEILGDTRLSSEQSRYASLIKTSSSALLTILDDVLTFSRFESGLLNLENKHFDLSSCLEDAIDMVAREALQKGLQLILDVRPNVPMTLIGDKPRLRQVLTNLLANAVKFTSQGQVVVIVDSRASGNDDCELIVRVKDTGIGIPLEKQQNIFQPFVQSDVSTTRKYGGSGLGLAICHQICQAARGSIELVSEPGKGSEFTVIFPLRCDPTIDNNLPADTVKRSPFAIVGCNSAINSAVIHLLQRYKIPHQCFEQATDLTASRISAYSTVIITSPDMVDQFQRAPGVVEAKSPTLISVNPLLQEASANRADDVSDISLSGPFKISAFVQSLGIASGSNRIDQGQSLPQQVKYLSGTKAHYADKVVLVVEDNQQNQMVIRHFLEARGCGVRVAQHGFEALNILEEERIDLVLMDIQMPVMDGITTTRHIRSLSKHFSQVPVVAVTADAIYGDRERFIKAGMNDYLSKPICRQELYNMLAKFLDCGMEIGGLLGKIVRLSEARAQLQKKHK
ncbi:PAS domain-containing protein [Pseudomaricurvus alcaniphilus]|uniref:PAS domain S-box protein n=1 Tax=Pseudomaricurvus alcaniphilus TaxID=1166482 RepID=UPI0014089200|nr:PAS domain S-box protein [Pseudomaricurvus alcaniphilus]NHN37230.1 PAS domain-containing protein [Pseudomaricurvus alcaniphilus]